MQYQTVIGLEVHIEPNTKSKMFCGCSQDHFGKKPNTNTCPICLGLPGALPVANKEAINKTIKLGLALGSKISEYSNFYRKHYFYPDLPKGFQTSQKDSPFCIGGELMGFKINHIHLEEDAGKLIHSQGKSLVDFNRSGCALIELVTEPVFHSVADVLKFTKELQLVAKYLDISNADMEKGTMRLEANISLAREIPNAKFQMPNYKVELKNINSFRFLEKAIEAEIRRQELELSEGRTPIQETRGYDENTKKTFSQRTKEDSHDYRYFIEPDLPGLVLENSKFEIRNSKITELPEQKRKKFAEQYKLPKDYIEILASDLGRANYFETAAKLSPDLSKTIANAMINKNLDKEYPEPEEFIKKIRELEDKSYESEQSTQNAIKTVLSENPEIITSYRSGKTQVIGFLIGQVQKQLQGQGNPKLIMEILAKELQK